MLFLEFYRRNPFVRILILLILGILLQPFFTEASLAVCYGIMAFLLATMLIFLKSSYKNRRIFGIFANCFIVIMGLVLCLQTQVRHAPPQLSGDYWAKAVVEDTPQERPQLQIVRLKVLQLQQLPLQHPFRVQAYFRNNDKPFLQIGDTLLFQTTFFPLKKNTNPFVFDYTQKLEYQQTFYSCQIDSARYVHHPSKTFSSRRIASSVQKTLINCFDKVISGEENAAIARALILGDRSALTQEIRTSFSKVGAMHLLAVSGLHVGILLMLLNFLTRPLHARKGGKVLASILCLLGVWAFAFLTGLSVSVIRSATMFSFYIVGRTLFRRTASYNFLATSAVLILLYDPFLLYDVGFQLSYSALLAIIIIVPYLYPLLYIPNKIGNILWQLTTLSIAAQIGVAPLGMYYFHQFPVYFLLTNLLLMHLTALILILGFLLISFHTSEVLSCLIGKVLNCLLSLFHWLVSRIESFYFVTLDGIVVSKLQLLAYYTAFLLFLVYANTKWRKFIAYSLIALAIGIGEGQIQNFRSSTEHTLVVHDIRSKSCYSILSNGEALILHSKNTDKKDLQYNVENLLLYKRTKKKSSHLLGNQDSLLIGKTLFYQDKLMLNGKFVLFLKEEEARLKQKISVDILVLSKAVASVDFLESYTPNLVILDSSIGPSKRHFFIESLNKQAIAYHDVQESGAFIYR